MAALLSAGLDPKVYAPMASTTQAAIRARPDLEGLVLMVSVTTAVLVLVGGAVGDSTRARPLILGGLARVARQRRSSRCRSLGAGLPFFVAGSWASPARRSSCPRRWRSPRSRTRAIARATAIGIAYAAYGAGQGISPVLVTLAPGNPTPAFLAAIAGCVLAIAVAWRRIPDLPKPEGPERRHVAGTALWAIGVVLLVSGLIWLGGGWDNPLRLALVVGGLVVLVVFAGLGAARAAEGRARRCGSTAARSRSPCSWASSSPSPRSCRCPSCPSTSGSRMGYGPVFGMVALAPLFLGLVAAGPIAGFLLVRYSHGT